MMNFILLWIELLLGSLLLVATGASLGQCGRRAWSWRLIFTAFELLPAIALLLPVIPVAVGSMIARGRSSWAIYAISLEVAVILGTLIILLRVPRHRRSEDLDTRRWHVLPLAAGAAMSYLLAFTTLANLNLAVQTRCALLIDESKLDYLADAPAPMRPQDNAAPLYDKAFDLLAGIDEKQIHNPPLGDSDVFVPDEPETFSFLREAQPAIDVLYLAAERPACRFDDDLEPTNIHRSLRQLNGWRNAANVLSLDARVAAAHGDNAAAARDVAAIFRIGRHVGARPTLICGLVGLGINTIGVSTLERFLPSVQRDDDLKSLDLAALLPLGKMFRQCLRGEAMMHVSLNVDPPTEGLRLPSIVEPLRALAWLWRSSPAAAISRVFMMNVDGYGTFMKRWQYAAMRPIFESTIPRESEESLDLLTEITIPAYTRAQEVLAECVAHNAAARTAVAIGRFHLAQGTWPSRLAELTPEYLDAVPLDPFDGEPLRMTTRDGAPLIYSIGPDRIDDGGAQMDHAHGDLTFSLAGEPATRAATKP